MAISLLKTLYGKWEDVREYLLTDLERIEAAFNQWKGTTFTEENILKTTTVPESIAGDSTADSRYISNQGLGHTVLWDQVNLGNGVQGDLPFANLVPATHPRVIIGRRSSSAGDFEELTLGGGLAIVGTTLMSTAPPGGSEGEDGADGAPGARGAAGPAGANGVPGIPGFGIPSSDGEDGIDGMPGPQGIQGLQGATGPAGSGSGTSAPGFPGQDGEDGDSGIIMLQSVSAGGSGTVTTVSVATANGLAGTVATPTTTPVITLTTSINAPVLAGNGTAISAATTTGSGSTVALSTSPVFVTDITAPLHYGGSGASGNLQLQSTSNATRGLIQALDPLAVGGTAIVGAATNVFLIDTATGGVSLTTGSFAALRWLTTLTMKGNSGLILSALFNAQGVVTDDGTARILGPSLVFASQYTFTATVVGDSIPDLAGIPGYVSLYHSPTFSRTGAGTGTIATMAGIYISSLANIGVGWTVTSYVGMLIAKPTVGGTMTNFFGIANNGTAAANAFFLFELGGMQSAHLGKFAIGKSSAPATMLDVLAPDNATAVTITINALQAAVTAADTYIDFRSLTGSEATIQGTASPGVIAYNTFTGAHYSIITDRELLEVGMLLEIIDEKVVDADLPERSDVVETTVMETIYDEPVDAPVVATRSLGASAEMVAIPPSRQEPRIIREERTFKASPKGQLWKTRICATKGSKAAVGVWGGCDKEGRDMVLSIGTGFVRLANTGVPLEVGDYLISSDVLGCAEAQGDDLYRSSTVAKLTESVTWAKGETVRTVACIYLGG